MSNKKSINAEYLSKILIITGLLLLAAVNFIFQKSSDSRALTDEPPLPSSPVSSLSDTAAVSESECTPVSLSLSTPSEFVAVDGQLTISVEATPSEARHERILWASSDERVLSVDENGVVTGKGIGSAFVSARTEDGAYSYTPISVVEKTIIYLSSSRENKLSYPVGDTYEYIQGRRIAEYCKERLSFASIDAIIAEDSVSIPNRAYEARQLGAGYYVAIHTSKEETEGARVAFNFRDSDSCRMSIYIKDKLASILETENKGSIASGINLNIKEFDYPEKQAIPAVYVEAQSHNSEKNAQWIIDNAKMIGYSIAEGILQFLSLEITDEQH